MSRKMMPELLNNCGKIDPSLMQNRSICRKTDFPKTAIIDGALFKNQGSGVVVSPWVAVLWPWGAVP